MKFVCLSDTHGRHDQVVVPDGDVLICAGDFTARGKEIDVARFNNWLGLLPHKYKIVIAGNHDECFEKDPGLAQSLLPNAIYLEDSFVIIEGVKIYGSPWTPIFNNWAFNLNRGEEIKAKWEAIPDNTDILITHGPAFGRLDKVFLHGTNVGCVDLLNTIKRIVPLYHVHGHIHEGYGVLSDENTITVNASICDRQYKASNRPIGFSFGKEIS